MSEEQTEVHEEPKVVRKPRAKSSPAEGFFPIKLKRNYRPTGEFKVEEGGQVRDPDLDEEGGDERLKMKAGSVIHVPVKEAMRAVELGIASRNDPFV